MIKRKKNWWNAEEKSKQNYSLLFTSYCNGGIFWFFFIYSVLVYLIILCFFCSFFFSTSISVTFCITCFTFVTFTISYSLGTRYATSKKGRQGRWIVTVIRQGSISDKASSNFGFRYSCMDNKTTKTARINVIYNGYSIAASSAKWL